MAKNNEGDESLPGTRGMVPEVHTQLCLNRNAFNQLSGKDGKEPNQLD